MLVRRYWSVLLVFGLIVSFFIPWKSVHAANEVSDRDLLIFSTLSYYSNTKNNLQGEINAAKKAKELPISVKEEKNVLGLWKKLYFLSEAVGFSATAYYNDRDNVVVLAYKGTTIPDGFDMSDDLDTYFKKQNFQARLATNFVRVIFSKAYNGEFEKYGLKGTEAPSLKVYITGHSLGGFLAQKAGVDFVQGIDFGTKKGIKKTSNKNIAKVRTFNALGFGDPSKLSKSEQDNYITVNQWLRNKRGEYLALIINYTIKGELADVANKVTKKVKLGYVKYYSNSQTEKMNMIQKHKLVNFYSFIK